MLPIPLHYLKNCDGCDHEYHEICYEDCECDNCDGFRTYNKFKGSSAYEKCNVLMAHAMDSVKNLLSFYDLECQPRGFGRIWHTVPEMPEIAKGIEYIVRIQTHYPSRWILLHNIVSLTMAAEERGYEPEGRSHGSFRSAFDGDDFDPDTGGSSFRDWYYGYMHPSKSGNNQYIGSDKHLRSLVGETHDEWAKLVTILGSKTVADSFDILNIVRGNLEELILRYPGPSDQ
jgi:hypothetical protein